MKVGNLKFHLILISFFLFTQNIFSEEKLKLESIQPTFEEDTEVINENNYNEKMYKFIQ